MTALLFANDSFSITLGRSFTRRWGPGSGGEPTACRECMCQVIVSLDTNEPIPTNCFKAVAH